MKLLAVLTLASCLTSAYAVEEFGGIGLDSSVPQEQVSILKKDLRYLFENPIKDNDEEFLKTAKLKAGTGDHLHNFILNRVKYIVGEYFDLDSNIKAQKGAGKYPNTPLPDGFSASNEVRTVMTNIGSALYIGGKIEKKLFGLKVDKKIIPVQSPRAGILQVGEGLFFKDFLINPENVNAPSNSISRLGTLFHEARHSDGNGKSTAFAHNMCPAGHSYEGHYACETSGNGSYRVGALSERHMLKNCKDCSAKEKLVLNAAIADNFDRVYDTEKAKKRANKLAEQRAAIFMLQIYMNNTWPESMKAEVAAEIKKLETTILALQVEISKMSIKPDVLPAALDDKPEGQYQELSVEKSSQIMKASLKK